MPNFSGVQQWHEIRRCTLVNSAWFAEVLRFQSRLDAAFWLSWRLLHSLSLRLHLSTLGKCSAYSSYHACSPMSPHHAARAVANKLFFSPSIHTSALTQPLLLCLNKALVATGPVMMSQTDQPYLHPLPSIGILRKTASPAAHTMFGGLRAMGLFLCTSAISSNTPCTPSRASGCAYS